MKSWKFLILVKEKKVGQLKKAVEEAILDGKIKNEKKSAIIFLKKLKK